MDDSLWTFGGFLRYARQSAGLSQCELATLLGVSNSYISDVENDRRRPLNMARMLKAARRLGISLLSAVRAKARGDGFFYLSTPLHHDFGMKVGALLSMAWLDLSPPDFVEIEFICMRALKRAGIDPNQPPISI